MPFRRERCRLTGATRCPICWKAMSESARTCASAFREGPGRQAPITWCRSPPRGKHVYEWSNYRLACALMNSRKGVVGIGTGSVRCRGRMVRARGGGIPGVRGVGAPRPGHRCRSPDHRPASTQRPDVSGRKGRTRRGVLERRSLFRLPHPPCPICRAGTPSAEQAEPTGRMTPCPDRRVASQRRPDAGTRAPSMNSRSARVDNAHVSVAVTALARSRGSGCRGKRLLGLADCRLAPPAWGRGRCRRRSAQAQRGFRHLLTLGADRTDLYVAQRWQLRLGRLSLDGLTRFDGVGAERQQPLGRHCAPTPVSTPLAAPDQVTRSSDIGSVVTLGTAGVGEPLR